MTDLRTAYATALLRRLEEHAGPLADVVPLLDRLDVLTGLDLEQKRLSAGVPPVIEGVPPVIEHGSVDQRGTSATASAAPDEADAALPVEHEAPQQVGDETVISAPPPSDSPTAPSPEAIPSEPYTAPSTPRRVPCIDCGNPSSVGKQRCPSCAGKASWTPERRAAQSERAKRGPYGSNRQLPAVDISVDTAPEPSEVAQLHDAGTNGATFPIDEEAHRQAAAAMDALFAPSAGERVCDCPEWLRQRTLRFKAGKANEAHRADCPMYKKGAHYYPLASQSNGEGVYASTCAWCGERRDFSPYATETTETRETPSVSAASATAKSTVCPKCGGHYASQLHRTACLKTAKSREPRHAGSRL